MSLNCELMSLEDLCKFLLFLNWKKLAFFFFLRLIIIKIYPFGLVMISFLVLTSEMLTLKYTAQTLRSHEANMLMVYRLQ